MVLAKPRRLSGSYLCLSALFALVSGSFLDAFRSYLFGICGGLWGGHGRGWAVDFSLLYKETFIGTVGYLIAFKQRPSEV